MPYIGKTPTVGNFQVCDAISVVNGQAAYTLQVGGVNVAPESANHMLVSLNGILQKPGSSFTISGSTMTFASNLATGDVIDFVQILGNVLDLGQPSDDTVTAAKLNNDIISGQTALTSSPDDTDELLISDAGTIKRIDVSLVGGKNTPVFFAYRSSNQDINDDAATKINFNAELFDGDSTYDASTNYRFTPAVAGKYLLNAALVMTPNQTDGINGFIYIYKNGSSFIRIATDTTFYPNDGASGFNPTLSVIVDSDADDYFEIYGQCNTSDSAATAVEGASSAPYKSFFCASKIIT